MDENEDAKWGIIRSAKWGISIPLGVVVEQPDPFREMGARKNSTETQHSGHTPRSGPEVKYGSSAKDGVSERLRCGTILEKVS